jgi:hypothetical protein
MLVGNEPFTSSDFQLITTTILPSNQSSVVFNNLNDYSSDYKHLQIRAIASHDQAGGNAVTLRMNGDTGSNYSYHELLGNAANVLSGNLVSQTSIPAALGLRQSLGNTAFGAGIIDLFDVYSTTKNKTIRSLTGQPATDSLILLSSGAWLNTTPITSLTLTAANGNLTTNSRFSLYGIRG